MNKRYPRVRVAYNSGSLSMGLLLWQARVIHHEQDPGTYLVGDFGPISYKWIAKRFLGKYPSAVSNDLKKMIG